ncbi:MAG: hypothetical protein ACP6IP_05660 [Candidatus Njordarchaeia archaeon]
MLSLMDKLKNMERWKIYLIALLIRLALLGFFGESWDIYVFITSTKQFVLEGKTPYEVALSKPPYIYLPYFPFIENWFAYPPLTLLLFTIFYSFYIVLPLKGPFFERFFIKLPMAIGDLLLAFFSYYLVYDLSNKNEEKAFTVEILILFNPLLILISSVWGMFDALVAAFIVLSLFYYNRDDYISGTFFYTIAALLKQTAFFLAPFLLVMWIKKKGIKYSLIYLSEALSVAIMVSLPFYISSPSGFLQQILMLHVNRPPWGYNIYTFIYFIIIYIAGPVIISDPLLGTLFLSIVSAVSFSLLIVTIIYISLAYFKKKNLDKIDIVYYPLLVYMTFIFVNKVTNEQYFVYLIALMLIYGFSKDNEYIIKLSKSLSTYLVLSTLLASMRFLIFIPSDVLIAVVGKQYAEHLWQMTPTYGEASPYIITTMIIAIFIIAPTLLRIAEYFIKEIRKIVGINLFEVISPRLVQAKGFKRLLSKIGQYKYALIIVFLLIGGYQLREIPHIYYSQKISPNVVENKYLISIHYMWWDNPSHDPAIKVGSWDYSFLTPIEGYYETKTPYVENDFEQIKKAGFNSILLEIFPGRAASFFSLVTTAAEYNLTVIPYLDIVRLLNISYFNFMYPELDNGSVLEGFYSLKSSSLVAILNTLLDISPIFEEENSAEIGNKSILLIDGIQFVRPGFGEEEISYQISSLYDYYNISFFNRSLLFEQLSHEWNTTIDGEEDLFSLYPKNLSALLDNNSKVSRTFLEIYKYSFLKFWENIFYHLKQSTEDLVIIVGLSEDPWGILSLDDYTKIFNAIYPSRYTCFDLVKGSKIYPYKTLVEEIGQISKEMSNISVGITYFVAKNASGSVEPLYLVYNSTWNEAIDEANNITLTFSWNDYFKGAVIEPTLELDKKPLLITKSFIRIFKAYISKVGMAKTLEIAVIPNDDKKNCCRIKK